MLVSVWSLVTLELELAGSKRASGQSKLLPREN